MPVYENERGTYIFNSKDLNMIEYIDQILDAGIDSLKIEGRMRSSSELNWSAVFMRLRSLHYMESESKHPDV